MVTVLVLKIQSRLTLWLQGARIYMCAHVHVTIAHDPLNYVVNV